MVCRDLFVESNVLFWCASCVAGFLLYPYTVHKASTESLDISLACHNDEETNASVVLFPGIGALHKGARLNRAGRLTVPQYPIVKSTLCDASDEF